MLKVTVDRTKWLRGEGPDSSFLLRSNDGKMCCLGFVGKAVGITDEHMLDQDSPCSFACSEAFASSKAYGLLKSGGILNSSTCMAAMGSNDDPEISDDDRERQLQERLAAIDIELEFIN